MAVNFLRKAPQKIYDYLCEFAAQTVLHGPKYFANHGFIEGGKEVRRKLQTIKNIRINALILFLFIFVVYNSIFEVSSHFFVPENI